MLCIYCILCFSFWQKAFPLSVGKYTLNFSMHFWFLSLLSNVILHLNKKIFFQAIPNIQFVIVSHICSHCTFCRALETNNGLCLVHTSSHAAAVLMNLFLATGAGKWVTTKSFLTSTTPFCPHLNENSFVLENTLQYFESAWAFYSAFTYVVGRYGDGAGNTIKDSSSVSLIRMR